MNCRACHHRLILFFSLGMMPLANAFLRKEEIPTEEKYNLSVGFCPECCLVQLINAVPPEKLFRDYIYFSSTSSAFLKHCKDTASYLSGKLGLGPESLVLEIASNDGMQLQYFKELGMQILGVDPAKNIAAVANQKGIRTIPEFFNLAFAEKLSNDSTQADLIFGANVLAHVPEITDFVKGVKTVLKPKGTAVFEFPYLKGLIENKFDTIYHEHVFYYSLIALRNLFRLANLEIYDVETTPMQGGSLRIFVAHPSVFPIDDSVRKLVQEEEDSGFKDVDTYQRIGENVEKLKARLVFLLKEIKGHGQKIGAYSAAAKGNVLLNYFGIKDYLDFIVDKSETKQGLYTPGTHLLVHSLEKIDEENPNYLLILCWNIADEVINMPELKKYRSRGGKFIVPIPDIRVI